MKPQTKITVIIFSLLIIIFIFGLILPNGIRAAVANNIWSIAYVKNQYNENTPAQVNPPPTTHKHGGMLLAHQALKEENPELAWDSIRLLSESPDDLVLNTYAQFLYLREDYEEALETWEAAGNSRSLHLAAYELDDKGREDLVFQAKQSAYEVDPVEYVHSYAYALFDRGEVDAAISLLNQTLENYPGSIQRPIWYKYLGQIYQHQGNYPQAVSAYQQALQLSPDKWEVWQTLGDLYRQLDEFQKAIACYERVIDINPGGSRGFYEIADLYLRSGQPDLAAEAIEKGISLKPKDINFRLRAGQIYEESGDLEKASQAYRAALEINPNNDQALQGMERLSGSK